MHVLNQALKKTLLNNDTADRPAGYKYDEVYRCIQYNVFSKMYGKCFETEKLFYNLVYNLCFFIT